ncbi:unnamed protein product [Ixodes pacificus]
MLRVVALASFLVVVAGVSYLERRPELGVFQDEEKCFPYTGTWHAKYRNFEHDKFFGATAKCVRVSHKETFKNGSTVHKVEVGSTVKVHVLTTPASSEGYDKKNVLKSTFLDGEFVDHTFELYAAYADCAVCKVLRHSYAGENACSLFVPEHRLENTEPACEFIFELLCGHKKFHLHDETCSS